MIYILILLALLLVGVLLYVILKKSEDEDEEEISIRPRNDNNDEVVGKSHFGLISFLLNSVVLLITITLIVIGRVQQSWQFAVCGAGLLLLHIIYTLKSVERVELGEQGVLLRFGAFVDNLEPGLVYAPLWIYEVVTATTASINDELPANPEDIYYGDPNEEEGERKGVIPPKKFAPIRVTFAPKKSGLTGIPEDDPFNRRMSVEVSMPYSWKIINLRQFIETIGDEESAKGLISDTAVAVFTDEFSRMTVAEAMQNLEAVSQKVKTALDLVCEPWGVIIVSTRIKPFGISHKLNKAIAGVPTAEQNKLSTIIDSQATATATINQGKANAEAEYEMLSARAEGNADQALVAQTSAGKYSMLVDAAVKAASNRNFAVVGEGNLVGGLLGLREVWDRVGGSQSSPESPTASNEPALENIAKELKDRREKRRNKKGKQQ